MLNYILALIIGGGIGFVGSTLIARHKYEKLRTHIRITGQEYMNRIKELYENLVSLSAELGIERALNEGLQESLYDAAVPSTKRIQPK